MVTSHAPIQALLIVLAPLLCALPYSHSHDSFFGTARSSTFDWKESAGWYDDVGTKYFESVKQTPRVKRDVSTSSAGMVKIQHQVTPRRCMQISNKQSKEDVPIILGECSDNDTWKFSQAGRPSPVGTLYTLLYHFELITNPDRPLTSPTLTIKLNQMTKVLTAEFPTPAYTQETIFGWEAGTPRGMPFAIRAMSYDTSQCMISSPYGTVYFEACQDATSYVWRFMPNYQLVNKYGACLARDQNGKAIMMDCRTAPSISIRPVYTIESSQVPGKCAKLVVTGAQGYKFSGDMTTGDCFYSWNFFWTKLDDMYNADVFYLVNPISEQAATKEVNPDPQIHTGPFFAGQSQQFLSIPVGGACKPDGAACMGVFGSCCSGQCAQTCQQLCKYTGDACMPTDNCCSAVAYCSHKPSCEVRNPLTCHKAGEKCWDCCGGRKCSADRKCACSDPGEKCVDDDDCCDAQAVCTTGICTAKSGTTITPQCGAKSILGGACTQDSDCCDTDGFSIVCNANNKTCTKVCYWKELEYCTNDTQCCPGMQCNQDQKCVTPPITGRPAREQCQLGLELCKTDYDCCDKCVLSRNGRDGCSGPTCNSLGNTCNMAGVMDARGRDCCNAGITCQNNKCVSCQNENGACSTDADCCPGTEPRVYFKCESSKCKKYWSVPTCLAAGEESPQANCFTCCNGYRSCTVKQCGKGQLDDNCYYCNQGSAGAQCISNNDCKSGRCDPTTYYCVGG